MTANYVAYYRVSTDRQGRSGLGLEAQQESVKNFLGAEPDVSYIEVESGAKNDRPELKKALADCKKFKATLIVAKLDRLARDAEKILNIVNSGIKVRFVDLPEINESPTGRLMLNMLGGFAEFERRLISVRTKDALAAKKARGEKLGSPNPSAGGAVTAQAADDYAATVAPIVRSIVAKMGAASLRAIAKQLQAESVQTPRGGTTWSPSQVSNLLQRLAA